ncbi:MAG TPA: tyrosine-type recombinase/integrase [Candidatus Onthocola gallistercoris]|uniref:Tyrosine-type recombinase/integrase n=1 Tax=Candidatus Onthocola gallistercoris TaxID=2840876 RepID=A0A9D1HHS6_9FIRM|nr:tyrosine-type recombinase/integrase [Candidatus Onthocola gallistercoris]
MKEYTYQERSNMENQKKLRAVMGELPLFTGTFFRGIEPRTSVRTRLGYAYDLRIFFEFMRENNPCFAAYNMRDIPLSILDEIKALDIEEYLEYLKLYEKDGKTYTNTEKGLARKLASLKTFYNYFFRKELIFTNPPALVSAPKLHEKNIIRLDVDEVARLLDHVESGEKLTKRQQTFHEKTKIRDLALLTLFLGTGIRVSECVGLDMTDVDLDNNGIRIIRKGGNEVVVYFSDEVHDALIPYLEERKNITAQPGHENALFLSLQKKRMTVRSIENLVKKYSRTVTTMKNITPHKLRSTYGTSLYRETGDIYLVADVLGHKDVNTTKKHYAALEDSRRRMAAKAVTLREKKKPQE